MIDGAIYEDFWECALEYKLSNEAKLMAAYILSCKHKNDLGCFRLPPEYITADLGLSTRMANKIIKELTTKEIITYCFKSKYVLILDYLYWNPVKNPEYALKFTNLIYKLPSSFTLANHLLDVCSKHLSEHLNDEDWAKLQDELFQRKIVSPEEEYWPTKNEKPTKQQPPEINEPILYNVPLSARDEYFGVTQSMLDDWREDFPAINIEQEIRKLIRWNKDNPTRRKTKNGILRHISSWLSRAQDRASKNPVGNAPALKGTEENNRKFTSGGWPIDENGIPLTFEEIKRKKSQNACTNFISEMENGEDNLI